MLGVIFAPGDDDNRVEDGSGVIEQQELDFHDIEDSSEVI
jgi:hypothetical protein